jgi:hypothetical protein
LRIINAKFLQAQHCEAHAQDLPGTDVSVGLFSVAEIFVEGFHRKSCQLSAVSFQLNIASSFSSPADAVFGDFHEDAGISEFGTDGV